MKRNHRISIGHSNNRLTLNQALEKEYIVHGQGVMMKTKNLGKQPRICARIHVPSILVGHKVKLVLIE